MPTPKLLSGLPDRSNCRIGGFASPRLMQVAWPGGTVLKQRWKTQIVPSLATCTRITSPHLPPFIVLGNAGQPSTSLYGLGSAFGRFCAVAETAEIAIATALSATLNPRR